MKDGDMAQIKKDPSTHKVSWALFNAQKEYEKTGNLKYVLLAMGRNPESPPQWALNECRAFYDVWDFAPEPDIYRIMKRTDCSCPSTKNDSELLNKIAEIIANSHYQSNFRGEKAERTITLHKAITMVTGQKGETATNRRLYRYWIREMLPETEDKHMDSWAGNELPPGRKELSTRDHPRVVRIIEKRTKEFWPFPPKNPDN